MSKMVIAHLIAGNLAQKWRSSLLGAPTCLAWLEHQSAISSNPSCVPCLFCARYSQNLKEKTGHMKQMAAELEMYHNQVGFLRRLRRDLELRLACEVQDLKEEIDRHNKVRLCWV